LLRFVRSAWALLPVVTLAAATHLSVASAGPTQTQIGEAGSACSSWIAARQQPELAIRKASISSWILGFISGINVDTPDIDFLAGTDPESVWLSIDKYCHQHPLHVIGDAVSSLAMNLYKEKGVATKRDPRSFRLLKPAAGPN
jgi:hypothetical protein